MVVLFVFGQQLLKGRGVYCKLSADSVCPKIRDDFYPCRAKDSRVEAGNKDITLDRSAYAKALWIVAEYDLLCVSSSIFPNLSQNPSAAL